MFSLNQKVLYGSVGVCEISEITKKKFAGSELDYYVLVPVYRNSSTVYVPTNSSVLCEKMRFLPEKDELVEIFESSSEKLIEWEDNKYLRHENFIKILEKGSHSELLALLRTLQNKNKELFAIGKRLHITDERVLNDTQRLIEEEVAYVFDIERENASEFLREKLSEVCTNS